MKKGGIQVYQKLLLSGIRIKIIGDSITAGSGSSDDSRSGPVILTINGKEYKEQMGKLCWASLFSSYVRELYPQSQVVNRSCSRLNSTQLRDNLSQFTDESDQVILLMIGANDRKQEDGKEVLGRNLKFIAEYLKNEGKTVILMSYPPSTEQNESRPELFFYMSDVDRILEQTAAAEEIRFISHYNRLLNYYKENSLTVEEMMMSGKGVRDGLHPPDRVHRLIFEQVVREVETL
ncbi:hypothetical protein C0033_21605 [Clostridium sp. chh4-2]|nr:hypothetical protein C0033_21605 [Clostridium sp. chh4-2]